MTSPPRTLQVSGDLHTRIWLLKIRRGARTLNEVIEDALDALESVKGDDL